MTAIDATVAAPEMTCKELVELVTEYFEGTLPPGERRRFEEHIAGCGACRNYLEQMRMAIRTCAQLTEDTIAPEARRELLSLFRTWKQIGSGENEV